MMFNKFLMAVTVRTPTFNHARIHQFLEPALLDIPPRSPLTVFQAALEVTTRPFKANLKLTHDLSVVSRNVSILLYNVPLTL